MGKENDFEILHAGRETDEPFSAYVYDVMLGGRKVAELGHDYRGDDHFIRLPGQSWKSLPTRVIEGGGPLPLQLSSAGIHAIEQLISSVR